MGLGVEGGVGVFGVVLGCTLLEFSEPATSTSSPTLIGGAKGGGGADDARVRVALCRASRGESPTLSMAGTRMLSKVATAWSTGGGAGGASGSERERICSSSASASGVGAGMSSGVMQSSSSSASFLRSSTRKWYFSRSSAHTAGLHNGSSTPETRTLATLSAKLLNPLVASRTVLAVSKRVGPKHTRRPCCCTSQIPMVIKGIFSFETL